MVITKAPINTMGIINWYPAIIIAKISSFVNSKGSSLCFLSTSALTSLSSSLIGFLFREVTRYKMFSPKSLNQVLLPYKYLLAYIQRVWNLHPDGGFAWLGIFSFKDYPIPLNSWIRFWYSG